MSAARSTARRPRGWLSVLRQASYLSLLAVLLGAACVGPGAEPASRSSDGAPTTIAEVHRSATCECCGRYEVYLEQSGFAVRSVLIEDLPAFKQGLAIPEQLWSCHTTVVGGYFVEGHVPVEVIRELLSTRPDIEGISLPRMPAGAPGMGGEKEGPWTIYAVVDGVVREFATY